MLKPTALVFAVLLACDSGKSPDPAATAKAEEPLVCGLFQAASTDAMLTLSKCTATVSAAVAAAKGDVPNCDKGRDAVTAANEKYLECIDGQPGGDSGDVDGAIRTMRGLADDMCKCTDRTCADKVTTQLMEFSQKMAKRYEGKGEPKVTDAQTKDMEQMVQRLTECTTKAMGA